MSVEQQSRPAVRDRLYVDGAWVEPDGDGTLEVVEASTEQPLATIPEGTAADARRAVAAARAAFEGWAATPVPERQRLLRAIADGLEARADEIAATVTAEVGMPLKLSRDHPGGPADRVVPHGGRPARRAARWRRRSASALVVREPVGVVGAITPWNYPLHQVACKVAPALAAGCTIVLKPSEVAPLCAFILAEVVDAVGLPAGVFNLVTGTGPVVGEAIASDPDVDMVSFTGSTRAGKRVSELASASVKRVALELGGKSPYVILDDADLSQAVPNGVAKAFLNCGQTCTRADAHARAARAAGGGGADRRGGGGAVRAGRPVRASGRGIGPLVSDVQRERVRGYIRKGIEEGARLVCGGAEPPEDLPAGFYVRPTVFSDVTPDMTIAQEEIFGPVLVLILRTTTRTTPSRIANDTIYGLAAGVWSGDPDRAPARRPPPARRPDRGQRRRVRPPRPFGGFKQSGNGRENGRFGLEEYLEAKALLR